MSLCLNCFVSSLIAHELKTNAQAWFIYKQTNMNELFIELSSIYSWLVWLVYNPGIGCMSVCQDISNVVNDSCSRNGCCQIDISKGMQNITLAANSFNKHTKVWDFNPCSFAFIIRKDKFQFSSNYLISLQSNDTVPFHGSWLGSWLWDVQICSVQSELYMWREYHMFWSQKRVWVPL